MMSFFRANVAYRSDSLRYQESGTKSQSRLSSWWY